MVTFNTTWKNGSSLIGIKKKSLQILKFEGFSICTKEFTKIEFFGGFPH